MNIKIYLILLSLYMICIFEFQVHSYVSHFEHNETGAQQPQNFGNALAPSEMLAPPTPGTRPLTTPPTFVITPTPSPLESPSYSQPPQPIVPPSATPSVTNPQIIPVGGPALGPTSPSLETSPISPQPKSPEVAIPFQPSDEDLFQPQSDLYLEKSPSPIQVILDAWERVEIYPIISEEVEEIPFNLGESFEQGDLLLRLKNNSYRALLEKSISGVDYSMEDLRVKESLRKDNLISELELLQSKYNLATAIASRDEALRNFQATLVFAPFNGRIGAIRVRKYERPVAQKPMLEIFNDSKILAKMLIPANLLNRFSINKNISIYVWDLKRNVTATVRRIGADINPISGTVTIEAEIDNSDRSIIVGMTSFLSMDTIKKR